MRFVICIYNAMNRTTTSIQTENCVIIKEYLK